MLLSQTGLGMLRLSETCPSMPRRTVLSDSERVSWIRKN